MSKCGAAAKEPVLAARTVGLSKFMLWKWKAPRALAGTAVLKCSTAMACHRNSQGMNRVWEVFSPAVLYRRRGTATSCLPAAISKQRARRGRACSTARIPWVQSEPLEGSKKGFGGDRNSLQAAQSVCLQAPQTPTPQGGAPPTLRAASSTGARQQPTVWDKSDSNQAFIHLYVYYFKVQYIHKVQQYLRKLYTETGIYKIKSTDILCIGLTHIDWKSQQFQIKHENGKETLICLGKALNTSQLPLQYRHLSLDRWDRVHLVPCTTCCWCSPHSDWHRKGEGSLRTALALWTPP